jgi:hypothetical protein
VPREHKYISYSVSPSNFTLAVARQLTSAYFGGATLIASAMRFERSHFTGSRFCIRAR